jgi:hypothetical protein
MRDKSSQYFPLVEKFYSSGLTKRMFCERNSVKPCTFDYWKTRYRAKNKQRGKQGFTSLTVLAPKSESTVSVHYNDGTRLIFENGFDASMVKQFIPAFTK